MKSHFLCVCCNSTPVDVRACLHLTRWLIAAALSCARMVVTADIGQHCCGSVAPTFQFPTGVSAAGSATFMCADNSYALLSDRAP